MLDCPVLRVSALHEEEPFEEWEGRRGRSAGILYVSHSLVFPFRVQPKLQDVFHGFWVITGIDPCWGESKNTSMGAIPLLLWGCFPQPPLCPKNPSPTWGGQSPSRRMGWGGDACFRVSCSGHVLKQVWEAPELVSLSQGTAVCGRMGPRVSSHLRNAQFSFPGKPQPPRSPQQWGYIVSALLKKPLVGFGVFQPCLLAKVLM